MSALQPAGADPPPDPAAELALGVLEGEERAAAEGRVATDPAFAADVEAWRVRLARIAVDEAPLRTPPETVWTAVERRLTVEDGAAHAVVAHLRRSLLFWRATTGCAALVAAGLVIALVWPAPVVRTAPPPPIQAASLAAASGGQVAFVAVLDPARGDLVLTPATISTTPGRAPQLWVIPTGGKPVSVGLAAFGRPVRIPVVAGLGVGPLGAVGHATLAVSLEPQGGSPTGQPTGPVVAKGELTAL